ncbi:MAG: hypothetical protein MZW92_27895 [Comamonadaceae bacterium]|nr:hypothetical protein [Comamonadaceae bacterium]
MSFWTTPSTFWANQPLGTPPSASDSPDGEMVEKGGVAQRLRTAYATAQGERKVYTCIGCAAGTTLGGGAATELQPPPTPPSRRPQLGAASAEERSRTSSTGCAATPMPATSRVRRRRPRRRCGRRCMAMSCTHGRPSSTSVAAPAWWSSTVPTTASCAPSTATPAAPAPARSCGASCPRMCFGRLRRLREQRPGNRAVDHAGGLWATPRDYSVDGPIGVYQKLNAGGGGDRVILYVGLRRGGRIVYAIDVTTPTAPRMLVEEDTHRRGARVDARPDLVGAEGGARSRSSARWSSSVAVTTPPPRLRRLRRHDHGQCDLRARRLRRHAGEDLHGPGRRQPGGPYRSQHPRRRDAGRRGLRRLRRPRIRGRSGRAGLPFRLRGAAGNGPADWSRAQDRRPVGRNEHRTQILLSARRRRDAVFRGAVAPAREIARNPS